MEILQTAKNSKDKEPIVESKKFELSKNEQKDCDLNESPKPQHEKAVKRVSKEEIPIMKLSNPNFKPALLNPFESRARKRSFEHAKSKKEK